MDDKVRICFDKEYKIRALQPDKFGHAEELEKECSNFVESTFKLFSAFKFIPIISFFRVEITSFSEKVSGLVEVLDLHAKRIDEQKLRVSLRLQ